MGKRLTDGNIKATWVPTISSISAPTVAELTAVGIIVMENTILDDGLKIEFDEGTVTGNVLASTKDYEGPGRSKASLELTYFRDYTPSADRMWSVMVRNTVGYLVVRRGYAATVGYAIGDKVEVYNATCGERKPQAPERESYDKVMVKLFSSGDYNLEATVA